MTDYLADVVMPSPESEETIDPVDEPVDEPVDPVAAEQQDEEDELDLSDEEIIVEPVKKEKISQEEIFAPKVLPVAEPPVPKKTRKKGRVMTEKQLEALAKARAKGIETRKRNAAEKKKMKDLEKEEKKLLKEQKVKKFNKLKKSVEEDIDEAEPPAKVAAAPTGYSQEQLDAAVAAAVEKSVNRVEVLRKERKKVKKAAAAKEQHDAKVFHEINSAIKAKDVWDQCFM